MPYIDQSVYLSKQFQFHYPQYIIRCSQPQCGNLTLLLQYMQAAKAEIIPKNQNQTAIVGLGVMGFRAVHNFSTWVGNVIR